MRDREVDVRVSIEINQTQPAIGRGERPQISALHHDPDSVLTQRQQVGESGLATSIRHTSGLRINGRDVAILVGIKHPVLIGIEIHRPTREPQLDHTLPIDVVGLTINRPMKLPRQRSIAEVHILQNIPRTQRDRPPQPRSIQQHTRGIGALIGRRQIAPAATIKGNRLREYSMIIG